MRAKELRDRSVEELKTMESNLRQEVFKAKFDNHTNQLYDSSELPKKRRDLARVMTVLHERELGIERGGPSQKAEG